MAVKTFGQKGAGMAYAQPVRRAAPTGDAGGIVAIFPNRTPDAPKAASVPPIDIVERSPLGEMPILTFGLACLILFVFVAEKKFAFDVGAKSAISMETLDAFGAASFDKVIGKGQWWRIFLAPLLHADATHLIGNTVALALVGFRLERVIGKGWLAGVFFASAFAGLAGSLIGNPHGLSTVGASGAITGLMGALLVFSFHPQSSDDEARRMRKTALGFGVPALAPLAFGASGNTDYYAHLGGAIAGGMIGFMLWGFWCETLQRPKFGGTPAKIALACLSVSLFCGIFIKSQYAENAVFAAELAPALAIPDDVTKIKPETLKNLLARYPRDPRVHIAQALLYLKGERISPAESEIRTTIALSANRAYFKQVGDIARALLALVLKEQGRLSAAKEQAREVCSIKMPTLKEVLKKQKLCP